MNESKSEWAKWVQWSYLIGLAVIFLYFEYPPLADFVEWEYQAFITSELFNGLKVSGFYLRDYPVPYLTSQIVMAGIGLAAGPVVSGKLTILIYLVLSAFLSFRFVKANDSNAALAYPLLLVCIICNSSFWSGYLNYQFGLLVIMAYLGSSEKVHRSIWANALFALLAFSCHGFCLVSFGLLGGMMALARGPRAVLDFVLACLPASAMTLWYLLVHTNDVMPAMEAAVPYASPKFLAYKLYTLSKAGPYQNFMLGAQADALRAPMLYWVGVSANALLVLVLLGLQFVAFKCRGHTRIKGLALGAMSLGILYLAAPSVALQVVNPGERLLYPQLLAVFAIALKRGQLEWPEPVLRTVSVVAYAIAFITAGNLVYVTQEQGYETVTKEQFAEVTKHPAKYLFWHRPFQFKARFDHMASSYSQGTQPSLHLIFPTSLVGERRD